MHRILASLAAAALTTSCAGTPDCTGDIAQAERAAWIGDIDVACQARAETAWAELLRAECAPLIGFHAARNGVEPAGDCAGAEFTSAVNLGRAIGEMERERGEIRNRLSSGAATDVEAKRLGRRLIVIERDLPQLEALARMQGLMPPAKVPDAPAE